MMVTRALYGLKSSGAAFRAILAETLHELGYVSSKADPDVWICLAVKLDGFKYYELVLCYVDNVLSISHDPMKTMEGIKTNFKLKGDKVAKPDIYLGAELSEMDVGNGVECWSMSAAKYCKSAVDNVQEELAKQGRRLPSKCVSPLSSNYTPETDTSEELKADGIQRYQELIGVLRWATEIGRLDILLETSWMSAFLASPRIGHLEQVYHMFGYLKEHPKRKLAFDPTHPMIDEWRFQRHNWGDFYHDTKEAIPGDMPELRGNAVSSHCFVDADLAGHKVTRRSQTGILIFVNRAPIMWYSKRQNQVESSTFGSEFIALKTAIEMIDGMRYKL